MSRLINLSVILMLSVGMIILSAANYSKASPVVSEFANLSRSGSKYASEIRRIRQENYLIKGQVTDERGAVIIDAEIILIDKSGRRQFAKTNQEGVYQFNELSRGKYILQVKASGFESYQTEKIEIADKSSESVNIKLKINSLEKQEVTVVDEARLGSELENNAGAVIIKDEELNSLPEDPQGLSLALQGLSAASGNSFGGEIIVDGFTESRLPPKKAIREIRINKNPYSAEFSRPGNGRIEIFTKPGFEEFHGGGFFEFNNNKLNSRNPFALSDTPYQSKNSSFYIGGPVVPGRASFFFNFEAGNSDLNNLINARILDANLNVATLNQTISAPQRYTNFTPRFDIKLDEKNTLIGRYSYAQSRSENAGAGGFSLASRAFDVFNSENLLQLTETSVLNQNAVNETRFQFVRRNNRKEAENFGVTIEVPGAFTNGGASFDETFNQFNRFELSNITTLSLNKHTVRTGGAFRYISIADSSSQGFGGAYRFDASLAPQLDGSNGIVRDASGQPVTIPISGLERYRRTLLFSQFGLSAQDIRNLGGGATQFTISSGNPLARVNQSEFNAFVQDDWRLRPNFTIGLGLRYETQSNIEDSFNFAPRVSFAWSKADNSDKSQGKNKEAGQVNFVVRGGIGIFYERFGEGFTLRANRLNGINQRQYIVTDPAILNVFPQPPPIDALNNLSSTRSIVQVAPNLRSPYSIQSTLSFEKQLPSGFVFSTSYLNIKTFNALRSRYINSPAADVSNVGVYGITTVNKIFQYESRGTNTRNQLTFTATKRMKNTSLYATYVLNKAEGDTDGADSFPMDSSDFTSEYGRSSSDIRHSLYVGGWLRTFSNIDINPIIIYRSGIPFNITTGRDANKDTLLTERPAFATDLNRPSVVLTRFGAFDLDPIAGQTIIPRNYGTSPNFFSVNLRISKTFTFGSESKSGSNDNKSRFFGVSLPKRAFYLTISVQMENIFNSTNPYIPEGNLSSPLFGQGYTSSGAYGFGAYAPGNRVIKPQITLNF